MGFIENIFATKPGGTEVGNLLRDVEKQVLNTTIGEAPPPAPAGVQNSDGLLTQVQNALVWATIKTWLKKNWFWLLVPCGFVIILILLLRKSKKPNYKK